MKAVLVATIGTRDLMFQVVSGEWYNVGDDQMRNDIIGEQAEVLADLSLEPMSYRGLTQVLFEQLDNCRDRLKPVILGKLLQEQASEIERVYLIGTNQSSNVREREKDTIYACELIKDWLACQYQIPAEIISLGSDGINPANFEQMFGWWRRVWQEQIQVQPQQPIWLCLKGGVGQTSEASRISSLSLYGDRIRFFEFAQNRQANRSGIPSDYSGPFLGTNYLWDRTQQQALQLLERYDYAGIWDLLNPYFTQDSTGFGATPTLVKAGIAWNQGEFKTFFQLAKAILTVPEQRQELSWWWIAYEQAQLAVIRLQQNHTAEAMLHSFRAVEGILWEWAIATFPEVQHRPDQYPLLLPSIKQRYPKLANDYDSQQARTSSVELRGMMLRNLLELAIPQTAYSQDFKAFWETARHKRNMLSHRLGGLPEKDVLTAWGRDINKPEQWEIRILNCLNLVTGKSFKSLTQASLLAKVHLQVKQAIASYQP
ncbi:hypothetical protein H6F90_21735 [Trichocoleus sp. FACHB-591]|uniref:hypothetical protein n=1 Tax=Trichocoleus sp. FACHB-591 TaxID=2692872 RepID=UPI00168716C4|nr:hypothetical protein [Trichocoleus sp. FACHB-591]MBD2097721.1 hypothetical protein [Trichocoleus sp. FACHB-591]